MDFFNVFSLSVYLNFWLPVLELQIFKAVLLIKVESNPGLVAWFNPDEMLIDGMGFKVGWLKVHLFKSVF